MANNNNRRGFLTMNAGLSLNKNGEKIPYAFHVEGIVGSVNKFMPADGEKGAMLSVSVAVGRNPWIMFGKAVEAEQSGNPDVNSDSPFVSLTIYGSDAERLQNIQKGAKVVFSGRLEKNPYKKKSGEDAVSVRVAVSNIYQLATRTGAADDLRPEVTSVVNCYESNGKEVSQDLGMISGKVKSVEPLRTTSTGREVISAKLELLIPALEAEARMNRTYNKDADYGSYKTVSISVWGQRATHMDRVLVPGNMLVVTGNARTNEDNNSNKYVNISVRELSVLQWGLLQSQLMKTMHRRRLLVGWLLLISIAWLMPLGRSFRSNHSKNGDRLFTEPVPNVYLRIKKRKE